VLDNVTIIIPVAPEEEAHKLLIDCLSQTNAEIIISSKNGRAKSMNDGANKATKEFLWFLHADTFVTTQNMHALDKALKIKPQAMHYFKLKFKSFGLVVLNAWGANIRSALFNLPYGDQGLCLSKEDFNDMGGFDEKIALGEDLLLVRKAKKNNIAFNRVPSTLITSARTYEKKGWLKTTMLYQRHLFKLLRIKL